MRVGSLEMAIFASFVYCLPNILHTWPHDSFQMIRLSMTLWCHNSLQLAYTRTNVPSFYEHLTVDNYGKSYYRLLIGNHTLAFDGATFDDLEVHLKVVISTSISSILGMLSRRTVPQQ